MTTRNNYTHNQNGKSIKTTCYSDYDLARLRFEENFIKLDNGVLLYTDNGNLKENVTFKVVGDISDILELYKKVEGCPIQELTKEEIKEEILLIYGISLGSFKDESSCILKDSENEVSIEPSEPIKICRIYGDRENIRVIILPESLKKIWGNDIDEALLRVELENLILKVPTYACVTIDEKEYNYIDMGFNEYEYEQEYEAFAEEVAKRSGASKEEILKLLPAYPPYL